MQAIWKGHISFGLVSVPVSLYSGTEDRRVSFKMLHAKDNSPIRYKKVCEKEDTEVPKGEIVKGYELDDGRFVILTDEDFDKVSPELTKTINIVNFVKVDLLDPVWMDRPYYLEAREGGETPYELLRLALEQTGYVGVCKVVLRNREHLAGLIPRDGMLVLELLRFSDEIRSAGKLSKPSGVKVEKKQLELAKELINRIAEEFHYEQYVDEYSQQLKNMIEQKAKGRKVVAPRKKKAPEVENLMDALQKSLKQAA